ncbi:hypothetical protein EGW08_014386 [Elysia chlorotica]|uniref:Uncharacterized protein n=1 Tax=Elysia chlorotica TaxID=188477 RepID=A0A433T8H2_ELYCH|nr:hypothetical protein EGW08_014386 [Elysia chlorotica]
MLWVGRQKVAVQISAAAPVNSNNQTAVGSQDDNDVPVAMIVCLSVGGYLILVIFIICLYRGCKGIAIFLSSVFTLLDNIFPAIFSEGVIFLTLTEPKLLPGHQLGQSNSHEIQDGQRDESCVCVWFGEVEIECCEQPPSCSRCCSGDWSCQPSCSSCCTGCSPIPSCFSSCSCGRADEEGCLCLCLEIKLHKGDKQGKPYRDGKDAHGGEIKKQNAVGVGDVSKLFSTHSPPQPYSVSDGLSKHDGSVVSDVSSGERFASGEDRHARSLRHSNRHLPRGSEYSSEGKAHVSFRSTHGEELRPSRRLPPLPGEETASVGTISGKNNSNTSSADLTNSDGSHRLSSRIRRSLQAGRRSQRYPNKFLVSANPSPCKPQLPQNVHMAKNTGSTLSGSRQTTQLTSTNSTQSTQLSSSGSSGQHTTRLLSSGSSGQHSAKSLLSGGANSNSPRRTLPTPKGFQPL